MGVNATVALCPAPMKASSNGLFQGEDPIHSAFPLAILQICLVVLLTRMVAFLLKPLRQPRVVAEIIGGIILGPSALGRNKRYLDAIFPSKSLVVLDTLANLGLLFFLFLVGLELDLSSLRRTGKQALGIAFAGISLPFALGVGTSFVLRGTISKGVDGPAFFVFMGVALSITAFPVLARILAELKLLTTDIGRMALSSAAVNDVAAWILLALAITLSGNGHSFTSLWVFLSGCGFVLCCMIIVPPLFSMVQRFPEGEPVSEVYVCATLAIVLAAGFVTDAIGIHALFGAFVIGVLVPKEGPFAVVLVEKVEDLVSGLLLPLYFVSSGLKTNIASIEGAQSWGLLILVITTACLGKIVGTFLVSLLCQFPFQKAITLGFLMNTKGLVELIVLNIAKDRKVLNDQTFAILVLMALFTTFITTPMVTALYKPARQSTKSDYPYRTIEREDKNSQLRILACFHSASSVPALVNLVEASRGNEKGLGLCVYVLHLMELSERPSAIRMVHKVRKNGMPFWNKLQYSSSNQVVIVFKAFKQLRHVVIRPMTAISGVQSMHEDICATAKRKRAAMIILPFHKRQFDGTLETTRFEFRGINKRVLEQASCSVGILIDRGLAEGTQLSSSASNIVSSTTITVLFFGGCDDREALSYGIQMAEHPGVILNVIRFIPTLEPPGEIVTVDTDDGSNATKESTDDNILAEVKVKTTSNDSSSTNYKERIVSNAMETIGVIKEFSRCNLILVGRMPTGQVAAALNNGNHEFPELGPVTNLLISSDFTASASVMVVQQYSSESNQNISVAKDIAEEDVESR